MNIPAFYAVTDFSTPVLMLDERESSHARVLRLQPGEQVEIFNGCGATAMCEVRQVSKKGVQVAIGGVKRFEKPKSRAIVATAVSKAVRRGFFMEKSAELGAWEIWVWQGRRSVGSLSPGLLESCQQQIIAGGKQARNPWFPRLINVDNIQGLIAHGEQAALRLLPWEEQERELMLMPNQLGVAGDTIFAIGPEGGFDSEEVQTLRDAQFLPVSLGEQILRCETAAVLCLGLHTWASQLPGAPNSGIGA